MRKAELFSKPLMIKNHEEVRSITSLELGEKKSFLKCMFREWFFNAIKMEKNLGVRWGRPSL